MLQSWVLGQVDWFSQVRGVLDTDKLFVLNQVVTCLQIPLMPLLMVRSFEIDFSL
jgi:hypothetical protein